MVVIRELQAIAEVSGRFNDWLNEAGLFTAAYGSKWLFLVADETPCNGLSHPATHRLALKLCFLPPK